MFLNTQVQISKCILGPMLSSPREGSHRLPPGHSHKSSAKVRKAQCHPTGIRILVIHSHFCSWGGSKNHGSDKLFSNAIPLFPNPWSAVECSTLCMCYEVIAFGSFLLWWRWFVFWEWEYHIKVMPQSESSGSLCHKNREHCKLHAERLKASLTWEGQD